VLNLSGFRDFLKDLGFRFVMAFAGVSLVALLAFLGDLFDIASLQSTGGILAVLLIGGSLVAISAIAVSVLT